MPIPKPTQEETQDEFISRCMGNELMNREYPDNDQRAGICYSQWRNRNKQGANVEKKLIQIELKADKEGSFTALIATLNVVDRDMDITRPGAFSPKTVLVSAYQHGSWAGALPVGKAVIREDGDKAIAEGEFNLNTASGRETYEAVKFSGELQEWSYGFQATEFEYEEQDGKEVRILKKVDVYEISPVLKGAGVDTMTLAIKSDKNGESLANQAEHVLADVQALTARVKALAALRREEGRSLSDTNREILKKLGEDIASISQEIKTLLAESIPLQDEVDKLYLDYLKIKMEAM